MNVCTIIERIVKRKEGLAGEYLRLSTTVQEVSSCSNETYKADQNDVPMLTVGMNSTAKHISANQGLLLDEARTWDEGVLEDFKKQRDALVSMRDMFDRRDRLARDTIPATEKRIAASEGKLSALRSKPEGLRKPGEAEKLEDAIMKVRSLVLYALADG